VVGGAEVPRACEASVQRLGVAHVDLYMVHAPFAGPGGRVEQWRGMLAAQEAGLCTSVGVSNFGLAHLQVKKRVFVVPSVFHASRVSGLDLPQRRTATANPAAHVWVGRRRSRRRGCPCRRRTSWSSTLSTPSRSCWRTWPSDRSCPSPTPPSRRCRSGARTRGLATIEQRPPPPLHTRARPLDRACCSIGGITTLVLLFQLRLRIVVYERCGGSPRLC
jgi:hypothetical protein